MPQLRATFSRYCPRALTVVVLVVVAALLVLANLSDEITRNKVQSAQTASAALDFFIGESAGPDPVDGYYGGWNMSSGWPLVWRQYVFGLTPGPAVVTGPFYSGRRLAADAATWLLLLAAAAGGCEWTLRRYRPGFRWSLRTMLVAVGLVAVFCAWFAAASKRARLQDPVIDAERRELWVERWGPKWLDVIGADRYCRRVVGADLRSAWSTFDEVKDSEDEELLKRLAGLPDLQYLYLQVGRVTPEMVSSLGRMRGLRILCIQETGADDEAPEQQVWREGMAAIGKMKQLEELHLEGVSLDAESLANLSGLTELQSLSLESVTLEASLPIVGESVAGPPLLSRLSALPRLESLNLTNSDVGDADLRCLTALPRLKSLYLSRSNFTGAGLVALRQSKPGIVIGSGEEDPAIQRFEQRTITRGYETIPARPESWIVEIFRQWKQQTAKK